MSRTAWLYILLLVIVAGGILWYQERWYRTPVLSETEPPQIVTATPNQDDIPAIDEPVYESVASADVYLNDAGYGIVVEVGRRVRFYPFQILVWHFVVNDVLNGRDLLVIYDPLTASALAYERETDTTFGVSGKVWNGSTLLYDRATGSLWNQLTGEALEGERAGARLARYPSRVMTWSAFKASAPFGQVLSRATGVDRDYTQNPYEDYTRTAAVWFPLSHEDARLAAKQLVFGAEQNGTFVAFAVDFLEEFDTIQSIVGEDVLLQPAYWFAWAAAHPGTQIYSSTETSLKSRELAAYGHPSTPLYVE